VIELVVSDDHKVSILDNAGEENTESENTELEGETETDFVNDYTIAFRNSTELKSATLDNNVSNITNPFLEIHSPPPELA